MTFAEFTAALYARLPGKHPDSLAALRSATVSVLKKMGANDFLDMEATASFQTAAGVGEYDGATPGFPPDIIEIQGLWYLSGSQRIDVPLDPTLVRGATYQSQYPSSRNWQNNRLLLQPVPSGAVTLNIDFKRDATRCMLTGTEIATNSTTETNPWFRGGEPALRNSVLAEYFSDARWTDAAAMQLHLSLRNQELDELKVKYDLKKGSFGGQAPMILGDIGRGPEYAGRLPYDFHGGR